MILMHQETLLTRKTNLTETGWCKKKAPHNPTCSMLEQYSGIRLSDPLEATLKMWGCRGLFFRTNRYPMEGFSTDLDGAVQIQIY